jgi:hypothetical protein
MNTFPVRTFIATLIFLAFSGCKPGGETALPPVLLGEDVQRTVVEALGDVESPVTLHFYEGGKGETSGRETRALLEFMAETSPLISVAGYSLDSGSSAAEPGLAQDVTHGPAIRIEGIGGDSLFFFGFPERKELKPFLSGVVIASGGPTDLPEEVETFLAALQEDVRIRIFTSPD